MGGGGHRKTHKRPSSVTLNIEVRNIKLNGKLVKIYQIPFHCSVNGLKSWCFKMSDVPSVENLVYLYILLLRLWEARTSEFINSQFSPKPFLNLWFVTQVITGDGPGKCVQFV